VASATALDLTPSPRPSFVCSEQEKRLIGHYSILFTLILLRSAVATFLSLFLIFQKLNDSFQFFGLPIEKVLTSFRERRPKNYFVSDDLL
jgi:hypothetical protein